MTHGGKTMKKNKNKKIVLASTIVLGLAAITSSALAAYIITGGVTDYEGTSSTVPNVEVTNKVASLDVTETDLNLNFASPFDNQGRVQYDKSDEQDLTIVLDLMMTATDAQRIPELDVTITPSRPDSAGYLAIPTPKNIVSSDWTNNNNGTFAYELTLNWKFGTIFGGKNPTEYFDDDPTGRTKTDAEVVSIMTNFQKYVNGDKAETTDNLVYTIDINKAATE